jgi:hypothetical protein
MNNYTLNDRDLKMLLKYYRNAPRLYARCAAQYISHAAYNTRQLAVRRVSRTMTVRSPSLVRRMMRYTPARGSNFGALIATAGSVRMARHTSWAAQEGLSSKKSTKTITRAARRGRLSNRVAPLARLKPSRRKAPLTKGGGGQAQWKKRLWQLSKKNWRLPFTIINSQRLPSGLYQFGRGAPGHRKIKLLQIFNKPPKATGRNPWLQSSVKEHFYSINQRAVWAGIIRRVGANQRHH